MIMISSYDNDIKLRFIEHLQYAISSAPSFTWIISSGQPEPVGRGSYFVKSQVYPCFMCHEERKKHCHLDYTVIDYNIYRNVRNI